jgi:hypothetical protein
MPGSKAAGLRLSTRSRIDFCIDVLGRVGLRVTRMEHLPGEGAVALHEVRVNRRTRNRRGSIAVPPINLAICMPGLACARKSRRHQLCTRSSPAPSTPFWGSGR